MDCKTSSSKKSARISLSNDLWPLFHEASKDFTVAKKKCGAEYAELAVEIGDGFSQFPARVPMLAGYSFGGVGTDFPYFEDFRELLVRAGGLDYLNSANANKRIIGGNEIYTQYISKRPEYVVANAENRIIADPNHRSLLVEHIAGRNVVFVCSGHAEKESKLVELAMASGRAPARIILNEGVPSIARQAWGRMRRTGYRGAVTLNHDDIMNRTFRARDFWPELKKDKTPFTVVMLGATEGNFIDNHQASWLAFLRKQMRPQDRWLVGSNNTPHLPTIEASYNADPYKHFALMAFVHSLSVFKLLSALDFSAIECEIKITEESARGVITAQVDVINKKKQVLLLDSKGKSGAMSAGPMTCIYVRVMNADAFCDRHAQFGFTPAERMCYEPPRHDPHARKVDYSLWSFQKGKPLPTPECV